MNGLQLSYWPKIIRDSSSLYHILNNKYIREINNLLVFKSQIDNELKFVE